VLEDSLTKEEVAWVDSGRGEKVLELRSEFEGVMRAEASAAGLTGRTVIAMMSSNHIDPDMAAEIFVLDGPPDPHVVLDGGAVD
jgi:uncharacterized protein YbcI